MRFSQVFCLFSFFEISSSSSTQTSAAVTKTTKTPLRERLASIPVQGAGFVPCITRKVVTDEVDNSPYLLSGPPKKTNSFREKCT